MNQDQKTNQSLEELIAGLSDDPNDVKPPKKPSVRDAIITLRDKVGRKVFTKRQLKDLVEAAFPELTPVAMTNLEASLERAKEHVECVKEGAQGAQNVYRFKQ